MATTGSRPRSGPDELTNRPMVWRTSLVVMLLAGLSVAAGLALDYHRFASAPMRIGDPKATLDIPRGTSLIGLARQLTDRGVLSQPYYFITLAYLRGEQTRIKAGEYALTAGMTPPQLLDRIVSGQSIQYPITFIEGSTFRQALAVIDAHERFGGGHLGGLSDEAIMTRLGRPGEHPEGRLFPDTYRFPGSASGLRILRRALERMDLVLAEEWARRRTDLPLATPYEALILASIIEKETAVPEERPEIGGVFVRRLARGMRLQTDPTVIYGLGERFDGNIRKSDLRRPTPYNTYLIQGLPPTPIALPGREAIRAALQPADGDSLYFVAKGDGTHAFSPSLDAHNRAVRRFILNR